MQRIQKLQKQIGEGTNDRAIWTRLHDPVGSRATGNRTKLRFIARAAIQRSFVGRGRPEALSTRLHRRSL